MYLDVEFSKTFTLAIAFIFYMCISRDKTFHTALQFVPLTLKFNLPLKKNTTFKHVHKW